MTKHTDKSREHEATSSSSSRSIPNKPLELDGEEMHGGNVDKIRTILFGSQMREYDVRFSRLEERMGKEVSELRDDLRRRADSLESYVRQEVDALSGRIRNEYTERSEAVKDLSAAFDNLNKVFEKRTRQLDEELTKGQRELRQQILEQGKALTDKLRSNHEDIIQTLERELAQMRAGKVDRTALANLFTDLAIRLNSGPASAAE